MANLKRISKNIILVIFILLFLISLGYWLYQVYYIHSTDFKNLQTDISILQASAHAVAAFQACVLTFFILALVIFVKF